jgi:hypothetical protein
MTPAYRGILGQQGVIPTIDWIEMPLFAFTP